MRAMTLLSALGVALAVATVTGATIEHALRLRDDRHTEVSGRLVRVQGHRVHLDCRGAGAPTVVLEAGLDHLGALSWSKVHHALAQTTRTCAYSRAGMLWSDATDDPFDARIAAATLHTVLLAAGESAPWLLVGHSLGGPYAMVFAREYLQDIAGMVLVDPSHPAQIARLEAATGTNMRVPARSLRILAAMSGSGLVRLLPTGADARSWTSDAVRIGDARFSRSVGAIAREAQAIDRTFAQAARLASLGDRPLVVLSAGQVGDSVALAQHGLTPAQGERKQQAWLALHRDLLALSRDAEHRVVSGASHYIQFDRSDVVIDAVRMMVLRIRGETRVDE